MARGMHGVRCAVPAHRPMKPSEERNGQTLAEPSAAPASFVRRVALVVCLLALAGIVWYAGKILLLGFAAALLAILLDFLANWLARAAKVKRGWAFALIVSGICVFLGLSIWLAAPRVADQVNQLFHMLPGILQSARFYLNRSPWGQTLSGYLPAMLASSGLTSRITQWLTDAGYGLVGVLLIAIVGLYLAADPGVYQRGSLALFPRDSREHVRDVLNEVAYALRWWVAGQLVPMTILGLGTMIGLWILHVPLAFTLGLFTGFMIFIPYIGAVIAFVVTFIVSLSQGEGTLMAVAVLFAVVHVAEGYILTPLVQRRAIHVPPALTIMSQLLLGVLLGFIGLALATPLAAAALVIVKMLWLHQRPQHHG